MPVSPGRVPKGKGYLSIGAPKGLLESRLTESHYLSTKLATIVVDLFGLAKPISDR